MKEAGREKEMTLSYHKMLLEDKLPQTIEWYRSVTYMYVFLEKEHIGQVQASVWTEDIIEECERNNIFLL